MLNVIPARCECGCGKWVNTEHIRNQPRRFIFGHHKRGKHPSPETLRKISESRLGQGVSRATRRKLSVAGKAAWSIKTDRERSRIVSLRMKASLRAVNASPNKVERALLEQIKRSGFRYVGDGKFLVGQFNPDFVNKEERIIVELFGRYWHKDRKKDSNRVKAYKKAGYRVVVIWDDLFWKNQAGQVRRVERLVGE